MESRSVTIFFTQEGKEVTVVSAARTLGELKGAPELAEYHLDGKKLTVRETRTTLETNESVLPEGDIVIFVYPVKSKAGLSYDEEQELLAKVRDIHKAMFNQVVASPSAVRAEDPALARRRALQEESARLQREMEGGSASSGYHGQDEQEEEEEDNY